MGSSCRAVAVPFVPRLVQMSQLVASLAEFLLFPENFFLGVHDLSDSADESIRDDDVAIVTGDVLAGGLDETFSGVLKMVGFKIEN